MEDLIHLYKYVMHLNRLSPSSQPEAFPNRHLIYEDRVDLLSLDIAD